MPVGITYLMVAMGVSARRHWPGWRSSIESAIGYCVFFACGALVPVIAQNLGAGVMTGQGDCGLYPPLRRPLWCDAVVLPGVGGALDRRLFHLVDAGRALFMAFCQSVRGSGLSSDWTSSRSRCS